MCLDEGQDGCCRYTEDVLFQVVDEIHTALVLRPICVPEKVGVNKNIFLTNKGTDRG